MRMGYLTLDGVLAGLIPISLSATLCSPYFAPYSTALPMTLALCRLFLSFCQS